MNYGLLLTWQTDVGPGAPHKPVWVESRMYRIYNDEIHVESGFHPVSYVLVSEEWAQAKIDQQKRVSTNP